MIINGHEIPDPAREPLADEQYYWTPSLQRPLFPMLEIWSGHAKDHEWLKAGLIHTNREAAQAHARALISISAHPEEKS